MKLERNEPYALCRCERCREAGVNGWLRLPREGAVRRDTRSEFTNPGEPLYSTALMSAEEFYRAGRWLKISENDPR